MSVGNQFSIVVNNVGVANTKSGTVSIDLQRPGRVPDRIAAFDAREGKVSRGEYRRALGLVQKA
jgi:hypothetical protein